MASATETIHLRVQPTARDLIDTAARSLGMNRTEFIIAASHREAESVLLDQRLFTLDGTAFKAFKAALDEPPAKNEKLRELLAAPAPWESR